MSSARGCDPDIAYQSVTNALRRCHPDLLPYMPPGPGSSICRCLGPDTKVVASPCALVVCYQLRARPTARAVPAAHMPRLGLRAKHSAYHAPLLGKPHLHASPVRSVGWESRRPGKTCAKGDDEGRVLWLAQAGLFWLVDTCSDNHVGFEKW